MDHAHQLPEGFGVLEPFAAEWALADAVARMSKRQASSIEEIRSFYQAMLPLGERALEHLREFRLGELPPASERLLKLMLSLAEVAPAVEWYDDPKVYDGFPIERIRYRRLIPDAAPQA